MKLRIFYDGLCPLCKNEMRNIKRRDIDNAISLEDINAQDFSERFPHIDVTKANDILHAETADGKLLLGLDVTYEAWSLVGKGCLVGLLRKPLIKPFADQGYLLFAKNRYKISKLLTGQSRLPQECESGRCDIKY
ncbi:thiol-disulfide oxidoreductase DCC family protein [Motilimonas pumila]|uniref:DUF393 domain-containing protein n=1 Tax=Motilimonas pumila TaxID=2303987 RepID=A0A418YEX6_9GAMM|nr:DUF393 domain-containing protein [Motilimonas pumila]RJG47739.1 DUF393 domain-containing protein [Motilimonas pumila]